MLFHVKTSLPCYSIYPSYLGYLSYLSLSKLSQTFQSQAKDYLNPFHNPKLLKQFFNFYPPYFGAGIRVDSLDFANHHIRVFTAKQTQSKHRWHPVWGSLYSMTDPFLMILLMQALGNAYVVWDKSASIDFVKAGKSDVFADFHLDDTEIDTIKALAKDGKAVFRNYEVQVVDDQNEVVATVTKTLYIRLRAYSKSKTQTVRI
ncbi:MAG: DUF4442 domain-containing protein [Moraxella osloensis]